MVPPPGPPVPLLPQATPPPYLPPHIAVQQILFVAISRANQNITDSSQLISTSNAVWAGIIIYTATSVPSVVSNFALLVEEQPHAALGSLRKCLTKALFHQGLAERAGPVIRVCPSLAVLGWREKVAEVAPAGHADHEARAEKPRGFQEVASRVDLSMNNSNNNNPNNINNDINTASCLIHNIENNNFIVGGLSKNFSNTIINATDRINVIITDRSGGVAIPLVCCQPLEGEIQGMTWEKCGVDMLNNQGVGELCRQVWNKFHWIFRPRPQTTATTITTTTTAMA